MESNHELEEIVIKNSTCYYFDEIIKFEEFWFWNHTKVFWFVIFHTKIWLMQNHCVLGSTKYTNLLEFLIGIDI